jgi:hypothetical protein
MSTWASRKKFLYTSIVFIFLCLTVGLPVFLIAYKSPTCTDGKKNQDESGVDCGGSCVRLCPADFAPVSYLWERYQLVAPGLYSVLAYVENPNLSVEAENVPYAFKLYDKEGILITEREGRTSIPVGRKFGVFESVLSTKERVPVKAVFEFTGTPEWKVANRTNTIKTSNINISTEGSFPRVEAIVENPFRDSLLDLEAITIVYDISGNAIAFSRTVIDELFPATPYTVVFTWPLHFNGVASKADILVRPK